MKIMMMISTKQVPRPSEFSPRHLWTQMKAPPSFVILRECGQEMGVEV